MGAEVSNTKEKILEYAKKEFLQKGFKNASLRNISKNAGVTTGAIYGYFKDKDSIFIELVIDFMEGLKNLIIEIEGSEMESDMLDLFATKESRSDMVNIHNKYINYLYDNIEAAKLIILCADGSSAENFIEQITSFLTELDKKRLNKINISNKKVDVEEFVIHMLVKFYITSICELIEHDIKREDALRYITKLSTFLFAGWAEILKG